ncbi:GNAT family N-acetyltransferase [Sphingosinicella sp. CPCC 101087]|uniref:GNAT family N-acetyltransferase n=1 Tax=Sphingosinicella sp. CPCC 101087 TaxID=2497754 RepID=UPI00101CFADC|nr:GNAT family N-acetyltransferase [Sphingosinicella sp. CPCC 101087]
MIETVRLRLRDWGDEDIAPFIRHTNTPAVMRWLGGVQTQAELRKSIEERMIRWQRERGFTFWVVERKVDGELLGFCGLKIADAVGSPVEGMHEIGWRLREDAWGQGYAREAAMASLDFAFDRLDAERVVAITYPQNVASWGLMERLGMRRRLEFGYDDPRFPELNPTIVYCLESAEWRA